MSMNPERDDETTRPGEDAPAPAEDAPTTELSAANPGAGDDATRERPAADPGAAFDRPADPVPQPAPATPARDPEALRDWPAGDTRETRALDLVERDRAPRELPATDFPVVWRGYDVHAVDAYVEAAEAAIAAYEERTLPTVAVQRALDRVGEQTASILREAEQAAEETARVSRAQADDRLKRAEREAAELKAAAEQRVRDLDDDIERLWAERQRLIDATRDLASALRAAADDAESRFPPAPDTPVSPDAPDDGVPLEDREVDLGAAGDELDRGDDAPPPPRPGA